MSMATVQIASAMQGVTLPNSYLGFTYRAETQQVKCTAPPIYWIISLPVSICR